MFNGSTVFAVTKPSYRTIHPAPRIPVKSYRPVQITSQLPFSILFTGLTQTSATYNYLKPFDHPEYQSHLSPYAQAQLKKVPLRRLAQIPFIRRSHWSPNLQQQHQPHKFRISNLSAEYLRKIHSLCKLNNVRSFKVRATYLSSDFGEEDLKSFRKDIVDQGLQGEMLDYFSTLATHQQSYSEDKVHLLTYKLCKSRLLDKLRLN